MCKTRANSVFIQTLVAMSVQAAQTITLAVLSSRVTLGIPLVVAHTNIGKATEYSSIGDAQLQWFPVAFLALATLNHLVSASVWKCGYYESYIRRGNGWICWVEYAFSASLMNIGIVTLCGATDLLLLLSVGGLTATTMCFGWLTEVFVVKKSWAYAWISFGIGCVPFLFAWGVITALYSFTASGAPGFVNAVFVTMFVAESSFAVNTAVFVHRTQRSALPPPPPSDMPALLSSNTGRSDRPRPADDSTFAVAAHDYESAKIWLSLVAKTTLAWLLFGGINAQS